ncbi:MAG TPA: hypothetical protein PLB12_10195, partial [Candidatus Goldiibacteriota bacterium]|nr:hypothetical protein [Candidatus Goldiibacteriota bacterium]
MAESVKSDRELYQAVLSDIRLRWIILAFIMPLLFFIEKFGVKISLYPILTTAGVIALVNAAYYFAIKKWKINSSVIFAMSSIIDNAAIAVAIFFSGGTASPLFALYFITLIDASFDFWNGKKYIIYVGIILLSFFIVYFIQYGAFKGPAFFDFISKEVVLVIGAFFAMKISTEMKAQEALAKKAAQEKEALYNDI